MRWRAVLRDGRGQATVEAAVVLPVLIVLALISYNLMVFSVAVARFDRVAPDTVVAHGVSPGGSAEPDPALLAIRKSLTTAMGGMPVEIDVQRILDSGGQGHDGPVFSLAAEMVTYRCTMRYKPWPSGLRIAGVELGAPQYLEHERDVVIDAWSPGVL